MTLPIEFDRGRYWRMLSVRWQMRPFDSGSHITGGRCNPPGMAALYLPADYNTAIAEMHQDLVRSGTLVAYDLQAAGLTDLYGADPAVRTCEWQRIPGSTMPSRRAGRSPNRRSRQGRKALIPSIRHAGGTNLVLWHWHDAHVAGQGVALTLLDPEAVLTRR